MEPTKPRARAPRGARTATQAPGSVHAPRTVTSPWDPVDHLKTAEDMAGLLEAALEDGHPLVIAAALGAMARAKGMTTLSKGTGLNRKSLYRALSENGNPELDTFIKVVKALGLQLHATPAAS